MKNIFCYSLPEKKKILTKIGRPPIYIAELNVEAQLVEHKHVSLEVAGSSPALVNLPTQSVSFVGYYLMAVIFVHCHPLYANLY